MLILRTGRLMFVAVVMCAMLSPACTCEGDHGKAEKHKSDKSSSDRAVPKLPAPGPKLKQFADDMCACTGKPCAQGVSRHYMDWTRKQGRMRLAKAEHQKALQHKRRMNECLKRALRGNR